MLKYINVVFNVICPIIYAYFTWMIKYSRNPSKYPLEDRFYKLQKLIQKVLKAFNVKYDAKDYEEFFKNRSEKPYLLIANHLSDIDPLIFIALSPKPITFVAKLETRKMILIGRCVRMLEGEFIDRNDLKQSLKIMKNIENKLNNNCPYDVMIFPEGTRNKTSELVLPYHHGTFRPAYKINANIQCFVIDGEQKILSFKDKSKEYIVTIKKSLSFNEKDYKNKTTNMIAQEAEDDARKLLGVIRNK